MSEATICHRRPWALSGQFLGSLYSYFCTLLRQLFGTFANSSSSCSFLMPFVAAICLKRSPAPTNIPLHSLACIVLPPTNILRGSSNDILHAPTYCLLSQSILPCTLCFVCLPIYWSQYAVFSLIASLFLRLWVGTLKVAPLLGFSLVAFVH